MTAPQPPQEPQPAPAPTHQAQLAPVLTPQAQPPPAPTAPCQQLTDRLNELVRGMWDRTNNRQWVIPPEPIDQAVNTIIGNGDDTLGGIHLDRIRQGEISRSEGETILKAILHLLGNPSFPQWVTNPSEVLAGTTPAGQLHGWPFQ